MIIVPASNLLARWAAVGRRNVVDGGPESERVQHDYKAAQVAGKPETSIPADGCESAGSDQQE